MASRIAGYEGVAVAVPVTVPYERFSIRGAHWFMARALKALIDGAGISKDEIDGLCVASFTLAPDSAVGLTQHLGLSPRWLDHIPMGGASAIVSLRRAARAVQAGDAEIVACIAGDTNQIDSFRQSTASFSMFAQDAVYPYGAGGPNGSFAFLTNYYMRTYGAKAEDFGKLCVAQRTNALRNPNALFKKPLTLEEYLGARLVADPLAPVRLRDALRRRRCIPGHERGARKAARAAACAAHRRHRATQRLPRRSRAAPRRLGDGPRSALCGGRHRPRRHRRGRGL